MRGRANGKDTRYLLAVTALVGALASTQVAVAQAPPPGSQPPASPAAQPADLSLTLEPESSSTDEGERFTYEARLVNNGPGTARDVAIVVDTPEEFDLDSSNYANECRTDPPPPGDDRTGRMVCAFGDLLPGAEIVLKFRGEFRDDGNVKTHVEATSTTPDPNFDNNRPGGERTNVQENEDEEHRGGFDAVGGDAVGGDAFADDEVPMCFGQKATIVGTEGDDSEEGTGEDDVIVTLGGDDNVFVGSFFDNLRVQEIQEDLGADRICSGPGDDFVEVFDGSGDDFVDCGDGFDRIFADDDDDIRNCETTTPEE